MRCWTSFGQRGTRSFRGLLLGSSLACSLCAFTGCSEVDPRPQLVVVVDTDAPAVAQLRERPELSAVAAVDTVLIELLEPSGFASSELVATNATDWPLSFGIVTPDDGGGEPVLLRLRTYAKGAFASEGGLLLPELVIDRLASLTLPAANVVTLGVTLRFDCFGKPAALEELQTCIAAGVDGAPDQGVETIDDTLLLQTAVGTAAGAREVPCAATAPPHPEAICIPGGFGVRGDPDIPYAPLQVVSMSPFWIDRTEHTVGRLRAMAAQLVGALPSTGGSCTWDGSDDMPVNCVSFETAQEACQLAGGSLPSAAQWEYAARGRGEARRYPWGDDPASCCTANVGLAGCSPDGPIPVGSRLPDAACDPQGDVSRDGVLDLGGNVGERVFDAGHTGCLWQAGIIVDPVCDLGIALEEFRGGTWVLSRPNALTGAGAAVGEMGFRCVYPDQP